MSQGKALKMSPKKLFSFSLLAMFAGLSLHYCSANNIINTLVQSQPDGPFYAETVHYLKYHVREMDEIVSVVTMFHARNFVDNRFTTEELATRPEVKAVVELLHEPLQALVALNSSIDLSDCKAITDSFETCTVWSTSANTNPTTARPFLRAIHARLDRCVKVLDTAAQQYNFLKQFMQRLVDCGSGSLLESQPRPELSPGVPKHERSLSWRLYSFPSELYMALKTLERWDGGYSLDVGSLASIRKFLVGNGENLAAVAARHDGSFTQELSALLKGCREGRLRRLALKAPEAGI
jgi:hypothetical protein